MPLAQENGAPLVLRHLLERRVEAHELERVAGRAVGGYDLLQQLEIVGRLEPQTLAGRRAARDADVLRDLVEPRLLELRRRAALEPAECVQERRLDGVFRLLARAELMQAVRVDLLAVLPI